jgi:hypothetical protein
MLEYKKTILLCSGLFLVVLVLAVPQIDIDKVFIEESEILQRLFSKVGNGIVYCYSNHSKTSGFFISKDGWAITAGHKVDRDFPEANIIYVKLDRTKDGQDVHKSTKIIPPQVELDLMLFKIDYKPKFYFKDFKKPHLYEENWIFGFRLSSNKVPSSSGFIATNKQYPRLLVTTASICPGNSGSPVINKKGEVLGVAILGYHFGDGYFIPGDRVKEFIEKKLKEENGK